MLVSIAERIGAPIGATTCPLRVTATTHTAVRIAVTIQPMSGSATTDSGGTTDSLTRRGGHAEGQLAPVTMLATLALDLRAALT
jgi:hypothetical protein